jgi:hypothetical protein
MIIYLEIMLDRNGEADRISKVKRSGHGHPDGNGVPAL